MESFDIDRPLSREQPVYYLTEEQEDSLHRDRSPYSYEPGTILDKNIQDILFNFSWLLLRKLNKKAGVNFMIANCGHLNSNGQRLNAKHQGFQFHEIILASELPESGIYMAKIGV